MEIDFLGLKSNKYTVQQDSFRGSFPPDTTWSGGVETSLSLSTTARCSYDYLTEEERKKKKKCELPGEKTMINYSHGSLPWTEPSGLVLVSRPVFGLASASAPSSSSSSSSGFLYYQNENHRKTSKLSSGSGSLRMLYSGCVAADTGTSSSAIGLSGDRSIATRGDTPTVAMARRATLARFLKKRSHRMNRARTTHIMGELLSAINPSSKIVTGSSNTKRHA